MLFGEIKQKRTVQTFRLFKKSKKQEFYTNKSNA